MIIKFVTFRYLTMFEAISKGVGFCLLLITINYLICIYSTPLRPFLTTYPSIINGIDG